MTESWISWIIALGKKRIEGHRYIERCKSLSPSAGEPRNEMVYSNHSTRALMQSLFVAFFDSSKQCQLCYMSKDLVSTMLSFKLEIIMYL